MRDLTGPVSTTLGPKMKTMWKLSIVCNTLLMCVFGLASGASQIKLRNAFIQYPHTSEGIAPPPLSDLALKMQWAYHAVPWLWLVLGIVLLILNWKKSEPPRDMVQLHTSATLVVGFLMLAFFMVAGIMPFIPIVVRMSP